MNTDVPDFSQFAIGNGGVICVDKLSANSKKAISINAGNNCSIIIEEDVVVLGHLHIYMNDDSHLRIGKNLCLTGHNEMYLHEPSSILIGDNCLFASARLWTSDMHSIVDLKTGDRINPSKNINIGNNVWLGADAIILK